MNDAKPDEATDQVQESENPGVGSRAQVMRRASTRVRWTWRCLGYGVADVIRMDRLGNEQWCIRVWGNFVDNVTAKREALAAFARGDA